MLTNLLQCFSFNLTDTLSSNSEHFANFLKSMSHAICESKTHIENLLLTRCQVADNFIDVGFKNLASSRSRWGDSFFIWNKVSQRAVLILVITNWSLKRDCVL